MKKVSAIKILFMGMLAITLALLFPQIAWSQNIAAYTEAIQRNPNDAIAFYNRGLAYAAMREFAKAIEDYTEAIRLNPNFTDAYNNRGNAHFNIEEYDKAIEDYQAALRIDPNHPIARSNLAVARQRQQQLTRERKRGLWFNF